MTPYEQMLGQGQANDPFAAIRTLGGDSFGSRIGYMRPSGSDVGEAATQQYDDSYYNDEFLRLMQANGFQSKYNAVKNLGDGRYAVTMQRPAGALNSDGESNGHKYSTMEVIYRLDPGSGKFVMEGDPAPSRQVSEGEEWRDTVEPFAAAAGVMGLAALGGGALAGEAGAAGAAGAAEGGSLAAGGIMGAGAEGTAGLAASGAGAGAGAAGAGAAGAAGSTAAGSGLGAAGSAGVGGGMASGTWFDWANLGAGLAGSLLQDRAASGAQDAQVNAARDATALQGRMFDTLRADQTPYREAGYGALSDMMGIRGGPSMTPEDVTAEPGYEFGRTEGMRGIENSAAARGMGLSGSALRNASRFNTDYASTRYGDAWNRRQADFGNRWNRLSALAGLGQTATQQTGQAGMNYGQMAGNNMMGAGNAMAAGGITRGNIWSNALNQGVSAYGRMQGQPRQNNMWNPQYDDQGAQWGGWTGDH